MKLESKEQIRKLYHSLKRDLGDKLPFKYNEFVAHVDTYKDEYSTMDYRDIKWNVSHKVERKVFDKFYEHVNKAQMEKMASLDPSKAIYHVRTDEDGNELYEILNKHQQRLLYGKGNETVGFTKEKLGQMTTNEMADIFNEDLKEMYHKVKAEKGGDSYAAKR